MDMIERVAKALEAQHWKSRETEELTGQRGSWADAARVAIEAMREPTQSMIDAMQVVDFGPDVPDVESEWRAAIDAANPATPTD